MNEKAANEHDAALQALRADELARLARIEQKLGVPAGYYQRLGTEGTDWEFSIKLLVLLEAALGAVIAAKLQNGSVREHCERLSLDGRAGKLGLAEDLGILRAEERRAFSTLAFVRNTFAHRVANIAADLESFSKTLPEQEIAKLCKAAMMVPKDMEDKVKFLWEPPSVHKTFRYLLWASGSILLHTLATQDMHAETEAQRRKDLELAAAAHNAGNFGLATLFSHTRPTLLTASPAELKGLLYVEEEPTNAGSGA